MPRQSRGRPAARPAAPAPSAQQTRGAHTTAMPAQAQRSSVPAPAPAAGVPAVPTTSSQGPGLMGQMAANIGSIAIGSTIGHGLSNMLYGGGSSSAAEAAAAAAPVAAAVPHAQDTFQQSSGISCDIQARDLTKCLESGDVTSCSWYLEQLKACQAAARPY